MGFARSFLLAVLLTASNSRADVFVFEADSFPEKSGWDIIFIYCDPELWLDDGWFFEHVELCPGDPPPGGQSANYRRSLEDFVGAEQFFIEWRMETDANQSEIPWGGCGRLSAWSNGPVNYQFLIASDLVKLNRDNTLPIIFVEIEPGIPHTYRLDLYGDDLYVWYIDGKVVDSGVPEGAYPSFNPNMNFGAKASWLPNTTQWDYIRYGEIASDSSGDFDSDDEVDAYDLYYFQECLVGPGGSWAGCAWADMDADGDTDCDDWVLFLEAWSDPADPPGVPECDCAHPDLDCNGSVGPFDLALLLGSWGPCPNPPADCPADLDGDGTVGAADLAVLLGSWG